MKSPNIEGTRNADVLTGGYFGSIIDAVHVDAEVTGNLIIDGDLTVKGKTSIVTDVAANMTQVGMVEGDGIFYPTLVDSFGGSHPVYADAGLSWTAATDTLAAAIFSGQHSGTAALTGGTINNTSVGVTTPAAGKFTTLEATSGINNTVIGATTPQGGNFTTLAATASGTWGFTSTRTGSGTDAIRFTGASGIYGYLASNATSVWLSTGASGGAGSTVILDTTAGRLYGPDQSKHIDISNSTTSITGPLTITGLLTSPSTDDNATNGNMYPVWRSGTGTTGEFISSSKLSFNPSTGTLTATSFSGGLSSPSISGNLTFTGTGNRILADFTNGTNASRALFQTSTTNSNTFVGVIPSGAGTASFLQVYNAANPDAASYGYFSASSTAIVFASGKNGAASYLPMAFYTSGFERMRLDTSGNLIVYANGAKIQGDFSTATVANRLAIQTTVVNGSTTLPVLPNGTNTSSYISVSNNSNPTDSGQTYIGVTSTESILAASKNGSGTYLPLNIYTNGVQAMRIETDGDASLLGTLVQSSATGFRNYIINGNMDIFQRGTTTVTTNIYGPADRWLMQTNGNTFSTTQGTFVSGDTLFDTGGAKYYQQIAVTSVANAFNYTFTTQYIENVRLLAGKTVTVSFWAKAASGTPQIGVEVGQQFGTGGSTVVTGTGQAITLSTNWTKYTVTIVVPSINGKTVGTDATHYTQLTFWLDAGANYATRAGSIGQSSKTVSIAQVQLEIGSVATPFENRPYATEFALCQRYYQTIGGNINSFGVGGYALAGQNVACTLVWPVQMRTTPSIVLPALTSSNTTGLVFNSPTATGCLLLAIATATGTVYSYPSGAGVATLSAEL